MKQIENMVAEILQKILACQPDIKKFDKGNYRAGVRVRKVLIQLRKMIHEIRVEIQVIKKFRKTQKHDKKTDS